MWFIHERCSSREIPRNFIEVVRSMTFPLIPDIGSLKECCLFDEIYEKMCFVFTSFNNSLKPSSYLI